MRQIFLKLDYAPSKKKVLEIIKSDYSADGILQIKIEYYIRTIKSGRALYGSKLYFYVDDKIYADEDLISYQILILNDEVLRRIIYLTDNIINKKAKILKIRKNRLLNIIKSYDFDYIGEFINNEFKNLKLKNVNKFNTMFKLFDNIIFKKIFSNEFEEDLESLDKNINKLLEENKKIRKSIIDYYFYENNKYFEFIFPKTSNYIKELIKNEINIIKENLNNKKDTKNSLELKQFKLF